MLKEFKEFALRGNLVDLAIGFIIGAAFSGLVQSVVNDLIMPIIGWITGGIDFSNLYIQLAEFPDRRLGSFPRRQGDEPHEEAGPAARARRAAAAGSPPRGDPQPSRQARLRRAIRARDVSGQRNS
jgi:hypothetical protein